MRYTHRDTLAKPDLNSGTAPSNHSSIGQESACAGINSAKPADWDKLQTQFPAIQSEPCPFDGEPFNARLESDADNAAARNLLDNLAMSPAPMVDVNTDLLAEERSDVFKPSHYVKEGGVECIDVMTALYGEQRVREWAEITAFKYQWRQGSKAGNSATKDKMKNIWYTRYSMGDDPRND